MKKDWVDGNCIIAKFAFSIDVKKTEIKLKQVFNILTSYAQADKKALEDQRRFLRGWKLTCIQWLGETPDATNSTIKFDPFDFKSWLKKFYKSNIC